MARSKENWGSAGALRICRGGCDGGCCGGGCGCSCCCGCIMTSLLSSSQWECSHFIALVCSYCRVVFDGECGDGRFG